MAAQALDLVPESFTAELARERSFYAARAKSEEVLSEGRRRVDAKFEEYYAWPDYTRWGTWKTGLRRFVGRLAGAARELGVVPSLLVCGLIALGIGAQFRRRRLVGFVVGMTWGALPLGAYALFPLLPYGAVWASGLLCVGAATGLWAGGLAHRIRRPRLAACACALAGGAVLILCGLPAAQELWRRAWVFLVAEPGFSGAWEFRPFSPDYARIVPGLLLMLGGAVGLVLYLRRRGARAAQHGSQRWT